MSDEPINEQTCHAKVTLAVDDGELFMVVHDDPQEILTYEIEHVGCYTIKDLVEGIKSGTYKVKYTCTRERENWETNNYYWVIDSMEFI